MLVYLGVIDDPDVQSRMRASLSVEPHRLPPVAAALDPPILFPPVVDEMFAASVSFVGRRAHGCRSRKCKPWGSCVEILNRYPSSVP